MKKLFIIANWKSNNDSIQVKDWIERFTSHDLGFTNKEIIICPSFVHLSIFKSSFLNHKLTSLGAQDISHFDEGSYTGEVNGKQIKEFADYVIVGHSERRTDFNETHEIIAQKIAMAEKYNLTPILCVSSLDQIYNSKFVIHNSELIVAYEPLSAVGSGNPDSPENAEKVAINIKKELNAFVLYGGSVNSDNVKSFTQIASIDGVLVGRASLDPFEFLEIIKNA